MSIGEILDEIQEGTEETDTNIDIEQPNLASEEIKSIELKTKTGSFKVSSFDGKVVDKFNNFYNRCRLQQSIKDLVRVDRAIAQEALATLPEYTKTIENKFTAYPSAMNKKLLDEIVFTGNSEVPTELEEVIREMLFQVNSSIDSAETVFEEVRISVVKLREMVNTKFDAVKPKIIYDNKPFDLLTVDFNDLQWIDDTKLHYDKYAGVLTKKAAAILYCDQFVQFKEFLKENCGSSLIEKPSIVEFVSELMRTEVILESGMSNIRNFKESATTYFSQDNKELTGWVSDLVNSLESVVKSCDNFNRITSILEGKDGLTSRLIEFVEFID